MTYLVKVDFYSQNRNDGDFGFSHAKVIGTTILGDAVVTIAGVKPVFPREYNMVQTAIFSFDTSETAEVLVRWLKANSYCSNFGDEATIIEE